MAAALSEKENSVTDNSDEVKEMFCELCEKMRNTIVTAEGYCVECYEYMCAVCILYHNKYVKGHTIQGTDKMQQEFCVDKCTAHVKEIVKFYCSTCDKIACTECKTKYHNDCSDISFIPEFIQTGSFDKLLKRSVLKIECLKVAIETTEKNINSNMKDNLGQIVDQIDLGKRKAEEEIKKHTQELIDEINRKKEAKLKSLEESKEQLYTTVCRKLALRQEELQILSKKVKTVEHELLTIWQKIKNMSATQKCKLCVFLKKADKDFEMLKNENIRTVNENKVTCLGFSLSSEKINVNAESNNITIGTLTEKSKTRRSISYLRDICVGEGLKSVITCLCKVSDSRLMATDSKNRSLLLIDTTQCKHLSSACLPYPQNGITKVTNNRVIVAVNKALLIVNLTKEDMLVIVKEININERSECIAFNYPNIFLLGDYSSRIYVLDIDGKVEREFSIPTSALGKPSMLLSFNESSIYIAGRNDLINTDFTGKMIKSQKKDTKGRITGLTSDRSGTLFASAVEGFFKKYLYMIYQWSSDLTVFHAYKLNIEEFLDDTNAEYPTLEDSFPLCYCDREDKLYIGVRDKILVYQI